MATHAQFSHSPTHDRMMMCNRRILQNCIYFIIITTVTYLWNTPRKRVLSHMHPNMLKIVTSTTNAPAFTNLSLYSCARHPLVQHRNTPTAG